MVAMATTIPNNNNGFVVRVVEDDAGREIEISALRLSIRAAFLTMVFLPVTSSAWLAIVLPIFRRRCWYAWLRHSLGHAGAAFVKWAQWSATRADLFPEALRKSLSRLQASAPVHGRAHTASVVRRATGEQIEAFFEAFDPVPVASGSIAQVHRARRRGRDVAVKVRHPRVALALALDAELMIAASRLVDKFVPWLRLSETVAQFSATLAGQADLGAEAVALDKFRKRFRGWRDVGFPEPLFSHPSLLVESFEKGQLVNSIKTPVSPAVGAYLVNRGEDVYLKMLLEDRVMHADLHPGNLLWDHKRLVLVDAGMVATLTRDETEAFVGLIEALGAADALAAARCVRLFSRSNARMTPVQVRAFEADVVGLFRDRCGGYGTGVDFGDVVRGVLDLVRKHEVRVEANFATLIINALCLDGMARDLYPDYSVLDGAKPLLTVHRRLVSTHGGRYKVRKAPPRFLGRFIFTRLCLPLAWRFKRRHDDGILRHTIKNHRDTTSLVVVPNELPRRDDNGARRDRAAAAAAAARFEVVEAPPPPPPRADGL
ncbi:hypothetical protein CTAYLR_003581 [Chrysophaeum taylorii]|uniref:ABC1 atypical kinase-like domain-containing protein n=1 Tax=Chrysophaeum taylorii TaxID=2483200 RepID=A0AAD7UMN6_9STRA|nr:hypothetical protein CTAYLR_003581 [Chrysophaeum taylorii]